LAAADLFPDSDFLSGGAADAIGLY